MIKDYHYKATHVVILVFNNHYNEEKADKRISEFYLLYLLAYIHATHALLDDRVGAVVRILAYYSKGCGFDSRTVQTFECMEHIAPLIKQKHNAKSENVPKC
jgi:hypothetical protein